MHLQPGKMSYWIQRADYTSTDFEAPNLQHALAVVRSHDWDSELSYRAALESAGNDWCPPGLGFNNADGGCLHFWRDADGVANCSYMEGNEIWNRVAPSADEQDQLLQLFNQRDYVQLRTMLDRAPPPDLDPGVDDVDQPLKWDDEGGTLSREVYWVLVKEWRGLRGLPPELTPAELKLSAEQFFALYGRERRLTDEKRWHDTQIEQARASRRVGLIILAGGTILYLLVHAGILPDKFLGHSRNEQWGLSLTAMTAGVVLALLQHLHLRALFTGTVWARRQSYAANIMVGTIMGVGGAVAVACFFVLAGTLLLLPAGGFREKHFMIAVGLVIGIMATVASLAAYLGYRSYKTGSGYDTAWELAWLAISPFFIVAMGVLGLAMVVIVSALTLQASWSPAGLVKVGVWLDSHLHLVLEIATALGAGGVAIVSWFRRKKHPAVVPLGLITALLAFALLAIVQVMAMWNAPPERPHAGPTIVTQLRMLPCEQTGQHTFLARMT